MRTLLGLTFGMVMLVPVPAAAQQGQSFEDLRLTLGETIVVRDQSGREVSGRLVELTADEIVVDRGVGSLGPARAPFRRQNVWRISRPRDPLWDGVVIGSFAGLGLGCWVGWNDYESGGFNIFTRGESCAVAGIVFGGIGAGIGAVGDLLWKNKPVYRSPSRQLSLAPAFRPGKAGMQARLVW